MTYISLLAVFSKAWAGMIQRRTLPWLCRFENPQSPPPALIKKWFSLKTRSGSPRVAALAAFFRGIRHVRLEGKCVLELWFGLVNIWTTAASQKPSHILIFWNRKHPMIPIHTKTEFRTWHMLSCSAAIFWDYFNSLSLSLQTEWRLALYLCLVVVKAIMAHNDRNRSYGNVCNCSGMSLWSLKQKCNVWQWL